MSQTYGRGRGRAYAQDKGQNPSGSRPYTAPAPETQMKGAARGIARGTKAFSSNVRAEAEKSTRKEEVKPGDSVQQKFESVSLGGKGSGDGKARERTGAEGGNGSRPLGRGGLRGRESLVERIKTRPEMCLSKKGSSGKSVELLSNYFKLETIANWVIFQYRVDFNIDEEREIQKKKWLREHVEKIGHSYLFDGASLFSSRRLTQDNKPLTLTSVRETDNRPVLIEIHLVQELNYGNVVYLQVFNILVRRALSNLNLQLVNRDYYDASAAIKLQKFNMELWPGYVTSIRQGEDSILMCSEISHKVMRLDTALDLLSDCYKQSQSYRQTFQQMIIGQIVLTDYNNKTYRIDDVDFSTNPASKFKMKNDEEISYVEYYETRYKIRIRDLRQPMLVSRSSARSLRGGMPAYCLLVPELCRMTGLSQKMLESNDVKRGLSEQTRINPAERIERLLKFNRRLQENRNIVQEFKHWDMTLDKDLVRIPARELDPENIVVGGGVKFSSGPDSDWTKKLRSGPMLKNGTVNEWAVIVPGRMRGELLPFLDSLKRASSGMDFMLPPPKIIEIATDKPAHYVEAVEDTLSRWRLDLIMLVCPNNRSDRYNAIKKKCCVDRGVPSQVVLGRSLRGMGLSIATKIAIQINCKIGGAPWTVDIPLQSVMVVGYDVCHDTFNKGKSYGAMVASLNNSLTSWFSAVSHHSSGEELSDTLSLDICKALRKYKDINGGALPARIFVYRDGVGEGQIPYVYEHEVSILKERLTQIYGGNSWKLGYIIVTKRINTRLFKGHRNPIAGTIVDDVITSPDRYDFFLVSQTVNSGTVSPTNYNVISDNLGLKPDQIQRWTFKMTHLYYNWSGTVRVPAPCQYAHKLAFLVSQSLRMEPHRYLETTLHFL
ncbi:UNVERIFIED_CONTAM: hypothetical protein PYX00_001523 [Menopon gallinae]|uniref:Piwi-like protein 1 n=1 Tax=Menopon gallinae TaxID=328185 RepID=A0AAW2IDU8_9NEOP